MDELVTAYNCHRSVSADLADSPILLSSTHSYRDPLLHTLETPVEPSDPEMIAKIEAEIAEIESKGYEPDSMARSTVSFLQNQRFRAQVGSVEEEAWQWFQSRHHELLQSLMARGDIPRQWPEFLENPGLSEPQSLKAAFLHAREHGFRIPDLFLENAPKTSYGEKEAFYVATEFAANRCTFVLSDSDQAKMQKILQVASSFLVPNGKPGCSPYVADQLWIVEGPEGTVRLIVLEIDGEHHLDASNRYRDLERDAHFNELGYEVYRVAGWWARIDPWRVIGEFLSEAVGLRSFDEALRFAPPSINDYKCFACGGPMVRWDDRWIEEDYRFKYDEALDGHEEESVFVHQACVREG